MNNLAVLASLVVAALAACSSTSSSPAGGSGAPDAGHSTTHDAAGSGSNTATPGFQIDLGSNDSSTAAITIAAVTSNGVYAGYYEAASDSGSVPSLAVSIHANDASLSTGSYPCARSTDSDDLDETAVTIQWLDGDTYYTNLMPSPTCTITITAASQASVSASVTGTIFDETDQSSHSFTAAFTATVQNAP